MTRSSATVAYGPGKKGKAGLLRGGGLNYCSLFQIIWSVCSGIKLLFKTVRIEPHHRRKLSILMKLVPDELWAQYCA